MTIEIPKPISELLKRELEVMNQNETRGSFFAERVNGALFKVNDVYFSKKRGTFSFIKMLIGDEYKKFQKNYHKKYFFEYEKYNYIGDWHSHPSFSCLPSSYDIAEAIDDFKKSNANFIIQIIIKIENDKLVGNAFLYDKYNIASEIELIIKQY